MIFQIGTKDIIDIILVAILLYQMFKLLKRSGAANIFFGIMAFLSFWFLASYVFRLELIGSIFDRIVSVGAFALIVLFQDEIRRFFSKLGTRRRWGSFGFLKKLFGNGGDDKAAVSIHLIQIVLACRNMARTKTGALIILSRNSDLDFYSHSGEQINATISSRLIENIFFKNTPLHDGAVIISNNRIKAASCILPVSKNQTIPKDMGLRHRSALGISEHSDAIAIIVSEETGYISWAVNGQLTLNVKTEQLEHFLSDEMAQQ